MATGNRCDLCNEHHEEVWYCTTCLKWFCYLCGSTNRDSLCSRCESKKREDGDTLCDWCFDNPCVCDEYEELDEVHYEKLTI